MLLPFKLIPVYRDYIWGGKRLRPEAEITAEAWVVYEDDKVAEGFYAGQTLAKVAELEGEAFLGHRVITRTGNRFPLLIKLLDCSTWLSLQVHPSNEQAERLAGPGYFGKTEAWYVIEAEAGAQLMSGFVPGVAQKDIQNAIGKKDILDLVQRREVKAGDTVFIAAGTIHALGPGLLIYEVQQNSDITYRVYDWDRPMLGGRKLHLEESSVVLNPNAHGDIIKGNPNLKSIARKKIISCEFFTLELISAPEGTVNIDLKGSSFSSVTAIEDNVTIYGSNWSFEMNPFETLIIPAICSNYWIKFTNEARALLSHCGE